MLATTDSEHIPMQGLCDNVGDLRLVYIKEETISEQYKSVEMFGGHNINGDISQEVGAGQKELLDWPAGN